MTPENTTLMTWSGVIAGIILAGWIALDVRGETYAASHAQATALIAKYDASHPAHGASADQAKNEVAHLEAQQEDYLTKAESALVPPLPEQFTNTEISAAEGAVREAINALEQKAQRLNITLPDLPFKRAGLDPSQDTRRLQLAQVYLFSGVVDACIDAGVSSVTKVEIDKNGIADMHEVYARLSCQVEVVAKWKEATSVLLAELLRRQNSKGYGVQALEITQNDDGTQRVVLTASLLTRFDKSWGLKTEGGAKAAAPAPAPAKKSRSTSDNT